MKGREKRPHRMTIRLPEQLYLAVKAVAIDDNRYVADWIVVTLQHAIETYNPGESQNVVPWPKAKPKDKRISIHVPVSLRDALKTVAGQDARSVSQWINAVIEKAVADRR